MSAWRSRWAGVMVVVAALLGLSCGAPKPNKGLQEKLAQLGAGGEAAVIDGVEKQRISPEEEAAQRAAGQRHTLKPGEPIWLQSGKSRILHLPHPARRVSVADPELAGVVVLGPRTVLINAKPLPEPKGRAQRADAGMFQTGQVTTGTMLGRTLTPEPRMAETTLVIWDERGEDVHSLIVADFIDQQVMLEVTVAEINRTAMEEHGLDVRAVQNNFVAAAFMGGGGGPGIPNQVTTVPAQSNQPLLPLTLTDRLPTYAVVFPNQDVTAFIQVLQTEGLASILAQPKLLAMSGQTAVFQVGGEIPIRISTGFAANIEFKPFGTLVNFVPRVSEEGDIVLTVTPEVSEPDFNSQVEGIPSFRTRRASTSTRLRNGETLVIGGLLQTNRQEEERGVPYLKDVPYLGYLFRRTIYTQTVTELLVVVTPHLVRPRSPGAMVTLPTDRGPLTREDTRTKSDPAETTRPRVPLLP